MDISEFIENLTIETIAENTLVSLGIMILAWWLLQNSLGRKALLASRPRRNRLNPFLAVLAFVIWYSTLAGTLYIKGKIFSDLTQSQKILWDNAILCIATSLATIFIIVLVKCTFVRGLKGFGLYTKNIFKDFAIGFIVLLGTWPVLLMMFILTTIVGYLIKGNDYQMPQHQELQFLADNSQISIRLLIALATIIIVPFFEEVLFRGIFQSTIRNYVKRPWPSIFISALIFATVHANMEHWPVIFVLGVSLGYSYEKTGRLYPAIFIHSLFNATSVISTLMQS